MTANKMPTIMAVDDEPTNIRILREILCPKYDLIACTKPETVLERALTQQIDLILLDIMMPGMDGFEVCRLLKETDDTRHIPIIFVTAMDSAIDEAKGLALGAADYVRKPYPKAILLARIATQLKIAAHATELQTFAKIDPLTGLDNRRSLDEALSREWCRYSRVGVEWALGVSRFVNGFFLIDIDHFKKYNDTYGHLEGDEALKKVAAAIKDTARRANDLVARFGGEEFAVLIIGTNDAGFKVVGDRILAAVRALSIPHRASGTSSILTVSIGGAMCAPGEACSVAQFIDFADKRLYFAKESGRDRMAIGRVGDAIDRHSS